MKSPARIERSQRPQSRIGSTRTGVAAPGAASPLRMGGIECDWMSRTIRRNGRELRLSPKEFDLLALLMLNVGRIFTREHLLAAVWAADNVDLRTVDVTIGRLRKAINRDFYPDPIRSVRGRGYKFREEFEEMHSRWVARGHKKRRLRGD